MKILNNWSVVYKDPYKAPEQQSPCLCGHVSGHERFEDGKIVTTSTIMGLEDGFIITYSGSKYKLGTIDARYESVYPDAEKRLLESLEQNKTGS